MVQDRYLRGVCWNVVQPARVCAPVHARQHAHIAEVGNLQQEAGQTNRRARTAMKFRRYCPARSRDPH